MAIPPRPFVEADVHAFVDGQMDLDRRAAFMQALSADPDLRAKVDGWRRQNEALTSAFGGVLNEPVPLRLVASNLNKDWRSAVARPPAEAAPQGAIPPRSEPRRSGRLAAATILAFVSGAGAAILAGSWGLVPNSLVGSGQPVTVMPSGQRGIVARASEAHQTYATDLNHPVEVGAGDEPHLLKWIQHRLAMPIRIPDLHRDGWTLQGGRILPGDLGPAAFLLYGNGIDRLGLYIARTNAHQADGYALDGGTGGAVAYWVDEPVGYAITTSRDKAWLQHNGPPLIKSIRTQASDNASAL